ncbi:hypothetical protein MKZ38_004392 [Zalerion maritima]|uniref:Uncharacterized protein n=1 Tax=Zalerion maritima TaxID=339359 RepID=A0AAD5WQZ8_9PEZI|nr:hypothetical protein MKZ38_004392 [Zalerion maritima]
MKTRSDGLLIIFGVASRMLTRQRRLQDSSLAKHPTNKLATSKARTNPTIRNFRRIPHRVSCRHNCVFRAALSCSSAFPFDNDEMGHNQRAERRRQKRSAEHSTLIPSSATRIEFPSSHSLVACHKRSQADEKFIPSTNTDENEDPYPGFPSVEECLEFCSSPDANVSKAYSSTSVNPLSHSDSRIDVQDRNPDFSYRDKGYEGDQLRQELLMAIATMPSTSEFNARREAENVNASGTPTSTTMPGEESSMGTSPVEDAWSSDAETTCSDASGINTPASAISKRGAQNSCTPMADLGVPDVTSKDALSGLSLPGPESQDNITSEPLSFGSSNGLLTRDVQALRILASAASTVEESVTRRNVTSNVVEFSVNCPTLRT